MTLTDEQLETLADAKIFLDELRGKMGSLKDPIKPATVKFAERRVAKSVQKSERAPSESTKKDH